MDDAKSHEDINSVINSGVFAVKIEPQLTQFLLEQSYNMYHNLTVMKSFI